MESVSIHNIEGSGADLIRKLGEFDISTVQGKQGRISLVFLYMRPPSAHNDGTKLILREGGKNGN